MGRCKIDTKSSSKRGKGPREFYGYVNELFTLQVKCMSTLDTSINRFHIIMLESSQWVKKKIQNAYSLQSNGEQQQQQKN